MFTICHKHKPQYADWSPVLSAVNDASDFFEPVGVVPVYEVFAVVVSRAKEISQAIVAQGSHCPKRNTANERSVIKTSAQYVRLQRTIRL